jgi:hypothetical protein
VELLILDDGDELPVRRRIEVVGCGLAGLRPLRRIRRCRRVSRPRCPDRRARLEVATAEDVVDAILNVSFPLVGALVEVDPDVVEVEWRSSASSVPLGTLGVFSPTEKNRRTSSGGARIA